MPRCPELAYPDGIPLQKGVGPRRFEGDIPALRPRQGNPPDGPLDRSGDTRPQKPDGPDSDLRNPRLPAFQRAHGLESDLAVEEEDLGERSRLPPLPCAPYL